MSLQRVGRSFQHENTDLTPQLKALLVLSVITILLFALGCSIHLVSVQTGNNASLNYNIDSTIYFYQNGHLVHVEYGHEPLTNLGLNLTFAKLTGSLSYNQSTYLLNTTFVSLGDGSVSATITKLPNEFIRVSGVIHAQVYNGFNITGTFTGFSGTNSSNCMGINYESASLGFNDLFAYVAFSEVTGIDSSFTITCEIQVSGSST